MKLLRLFTFVSIVYVCSLYGQVAVGVDARENWTRIESASKDFSLAIPSDFIVYKEDSAVRVFYYRNGVQFQVSMEQKKNAKRDFELSIAYLQNRAEQYEFFSSGDFVGMQFNGKEELSGTFYKSFVLASSNGVYNVSASSKNLTVNDYARFLFSMRLNGQPLFIPKTDFPAESRNISISSLASDELVLKALRLPDSTQKDFEKAESSDNKIIDDTTAYSRGLIVLSKPRASYTDRARQKQKQGTVRLKVTFFADNQVGAIKLINSIDRDLDKEAFKALRKMKFLPAEVNGKPVDVTKFVEYSFAIY